MKTFIKPIIDKLFGDSKHDDPSKDQHQYNCPVCAEENGYEVDNKYNLEVNYHRNVFKCWKCLNFSGNIGSLIFRYGDKKDLSLYKELSLFYYDDHHKTDEEEISVNIKLPKEYVSFADIDISRYEHIEMYNYLTKKRGLTKEIIERYNIGFCVDGYYKDRIIIPSYDKNNNLNYFIARTIRDNVKPKYLNPSIKKGSIIFNEKNINWDGTLYIFEGILECINLPINSTILLGKEIFLMVYKEIVKYKPNIVIVLNKDAIDDLMYMYDILVNTGLKDKVKIVSLQTDDDINDIFVKNGEEAIKDVLYTSTEIDDEEFIKINLNR